MATQRAIPGANPPESGSSTGRRNRGSADLGQTPEVTTELPGESGLGSGAGTTTSGIGASESYGVTGAAGSSIGAGEGYGTTGAGASSSGIGAGEGYGSTGASTSSFGQSEHRGTREFPRAAGVMNQVKQQASSRVNEQKARAAEGLGSVASAIRQASEHLRNENQTLATYADKAVDQIQLFADRMRDKDPAEMVRDAERFARRNPTAFIAGAFVLGLALARFLKSSGESDFGDHDVHRDSDFGDSGFNRGEGYGSYGSTTSYGSTSSYGSGAGSGSSIGSTPGISS
jgi:hypothetical protein